MRTEGARGARRKGVAYTGHALDRPWWYGDAWSVMDAYLAWVGWRIAGADFLMDDFPRFADHQRRSNERSATKRALEIEAAAAADLKVQGLVFTPTPLPAR